MITVIDSGVYKGKTYFIETDSGEKYYVNESVYAEFNITKGVKVSEETLNDLLSADNYRKARERALYLLDNREYGFAELYNKLRRNYDEKTCISVCQKLAEYGMIDDRRYAGRLADYYIHMKKFGRYRAKQEILKKGILAEAADDALAEYVDDEPTELKAVIKQKYEKYLTDEKGVKKTVAALMRRGFSYSEIKKVLKEYEFE